jgi:hypothetical protein
MYNLPPAPPAFAYPPTPPIGYPPHIEVAGTNLVVKMLDAYPEAVCNDGTPGGYYWSKGTDPSLWLVYLQGGYWCTDRLTWCARARVCAKGGWHAADMPAPRLPWRPAATGA